MDVEISREKQEFWKTVLHYQQFKDAPRGDSDATLLKESSLAAQLSQIRNVLVLLLLIF